MARSRFPLRLSRFLRFVRTFQDLSRYLDIIETFWRTSGSKILTNWEISIKKSDKIDLLLIKIETNCRDLPKSSRLDRFLDQDFWDWKVMLRQNQDISIKKSRLSRPTFCRCQDILDCWDLPFQSVEIETLNRDHVETNRDPQA